MAVSTDNAFSGPFLTNGATTQFPFSFTAPDPAEVAVAMFDDQDRRSDVPRADYSVALNGGDGAPSGGGSVSFTQPPAAGQRLFVLLAPAFTQGIAFENGSAWLAEPVNEAHDRAALRDQALARELDLAPKVALGEQPPTIGRFSEGEVIGVVDGAWRGVENTPVAAESAAARAESARAASATAQSASETAAQQAATARDGAQEAEHNATEARDAAFAYSGQMVRGSWAELAGITGTAGGVGVVLSPDSGTHTDPVAGGTVANSGTYSWSASPAGWRRIGDLESQVARAAAEAAAVSATSVSGLTSIILGLDSAVKPIPYASGLVLEDDDGFESGKFDRDGIKGIGWRVTSTKISNEIFEISDELNSSTIYDHDQFENSIRPELLVAPQQKNTITLRDHDGLEADLALRSDVPLASVALGQDEISRRNTANLAYSNALSRAINPNIQRPTFGLNLILTLGQSLRNGMEGWPAKSIIPVSGNWMIGGSVRPNKRADPVWEPVGAAILNPLKAVVQTVDMTTILTDAQVASLVAGSGHFGETMDVGAINFFRKCWLAHHCLATDSTRENVVVNAAVDGRTIEALSKGATPDLWNRVITGVTAAQTIAAARGSTIGIPAVLFAQGEWNYRADTGGNQTLLGYKNKLLQYRNDVLTDICQGMLNQPAPPAFITYQTGASYTSDAYDMAIGQAQLELALEQENWFLAGPIYQVTDKGGHLGPNGYRWQGMQEGKVMHRVLTLGQGWEPVHIRNATISGDEILLDYHVPEPPLVFDLPYVLDNSTNYADKGFRVLVNGTAVSIANIEILLQTIIRIRLTNTVPAGSNVKVLYASKTGSNGNGCVRDSDPTVAPYLYEYADGSGDYASSNIPSLIGQPYPLHNWACAQAKNTSELY